VVSVGSLGIVSAVRAGDTAIKKGQPMRLDEWDVTIQKIIVECNHEQKGSDKVLAKWRATLEKEPSQLQPFQIDEIVREVRRRLGNISRSDK
jgi:hypothetical protein